MRTKQIRQMLMGLLALAAIGFLAGCGGADATETVAAEDVPVVASDADGKVIAEAVIEPARWSELRFEAAGKVVEVPMQEGDTVSEGDLLARLETGDLERAVAQAELNLRQAQLKLERLQKPADEADIRQAEHAVDQAAAALTTAQMNLTTVLNSTLLNETLEDAQQVYEEMQHQYETRLEMYESGEEPDYWFVDQAQKQLDDAKLNLDRVRQQGNLQLQDARNEVNRAHQAYQEAQDNLEQLLKGAAPQDIEAARLDIRAAELALEEARSQLEDAALHAPFAGTVTKLNVEVGETASPGEVVIVLATLDQLQARTVDLTELDVARVVEGQPATVTVDALPGTSLSGHVTHVDLQSEDYRGDVTYPVTVGLDDAVPELRWGMTAVVEIEVD